MPSQITGKSQAVEAGAKSKTKKGEMRMVKQVLRAFFNFAENYDGNISVRKVKEERGVTFYRVETDGNTFEAVIHNDDQDTVFYHGEGIMGQWKSTDGGEVVEIDGIPYILDKTTKKMTASEIAKIAGVCVATVYSRAKELGRMPTIEEIKVKKLGRPRKY